MEPGWFCPTHSKLNPWDAKVCDKERVYSKGGQVQRQGTDLRWMSLKAKRTGIFMRWSIKQQGGLRRGEGGERGERWLEKHAVIVILCRCNQATGPLTSQGYQGVTRACPGGGWVVLTNPNQLSSNEMQLTPSTWERTQANIMLFRATCYLKNMQAHLL